MPAACKPHAQTKRDVDLMRTLQSCVLDFRRINPATQKKVAE
jgi:hypothetical protein